ncbi:MAG TPA: hypothetical protein VMZ06_13365 [Candidatus Bathyarchaeia archaeon]|nr:hypothetical protein [Candidatus Bathyarchaeia archaeon]
MPAKTNLEAILERSAKFVVGKKAQWDHEGWESFLKSVDGLGLSMDDETKRHLGNILESSKHLYENGGNRAVATSAAMPKAPKKKA